jgi:hypothetical protein
MFLLFRSFHLKDSLIVYSKPAVFLEGAPQN